MRAILGKPDFQDSAYILVLRGLDFQAVDYLRYHIQNYPTWGCLIFPDMGEEYMSSEILSAKPTSIHRIFTEEICVCF